MYLTQFWDGEPIPPELPALLESFRALNPAMTYRCFDAAAADRYIGTHFGARKLAAFRACAVPAMQADYFRYCALLADGGFYADADSRCHAPLVALLPEGSDAVLFQRDGWGVVNGVMGFRQAANSLMATVLEIATQSIEDRVSDRVWLATGPGILCCLHEIWGAARERREPAPGDDDEFARMRRLCHDIARTRHSDLAQLFAGILIARYPQDLASHVQEVAMDYKQTDRHWQHWPGSIYR